MIAHVWKGQLEKKIIFHALTMSDLKDDVNQIRRTEPTPPVPEGMTKSAWKRELRRRKWEIEKDEYTQRRKEKRKALKLEKRINRQSNVEVKPESAKSNSKPGVHLPITVIIDCGFDDLMKDQERKSLSTQLIRCYSENRKSPYVVDLKVTSLDKKLLDRFEGPMKGQYKFWTKNISFSQDDYEVPGDKTSIVYLSADADQTVTELEENKTYIIGGIVDKGRYKNLCKDKADKQGISTARLPIEDYIKLSGRRVLTTNHVFEILLRWLEYKDWKVAFETVLPQRKLVKASNEQFNHDTEQEEEGEYDLLPDT